MNRPASTAHRRFALQEAALSCARSLRESGFRTRTKPGLRSFVVSFVASIVDKVTDKVRDKVCSSSRFNWWPQAARGATEPRTLNPSLAQTGGLAIACFVLLGFCPAARGEEAAQPYFSENLSWGSVEIHLRAEPAVVQLERDLNVVLTVTAPATQTVELPDLRARFQGFVVAEGFPRDPVLLPDGRRSREYRWRLVPDVAREYRLAPFAVTVREPSATPDAARSFATRPVVFPAAPRDPSVAGDVEIDPKPFWIAPTRRDVFGAVVLLGLVTVLVVFLVRLFLYLRRQVRLRRLSPRERAFVELNSLLNRRLLEQGLFKDFYIELTQVVRRYIERAHGIRAPEQTTEEFLSAAKDHPRFPPSVLGRLREFLESADLVKFAGQASNPQVAEASVRTARTYIEEDAAAVVTAAKTEPGRGD